MDLSSIQPLLDWLAAHQQWVAAAIFLISFLESLAIAGIVIPGVLLLFGASAMAGSGILGVWPTLACALAGAVLGDCISFFMGKLMKDHIRDLWPFKKYPQWIRSGEQFFFRHGGKSIIMGRFIGPIRPIMPIVAGMLDMPSPRFITINLFSALAWAPFYVLPGFVFGASLHQGMTFPEGLGKLALLLLAIIAVSLLVIRLTHWHLQPDSYIYRVLHGWIERQHNVRLFWHWLAERRGKRLTFPLISMLLFIFSTIAFCTLTLLATETALFVTFNQQVLDYFIALQHPWLDPVFNHASRIGEANCLRGLAAIFVVWLLVKRYVAAAVHVSLALLAGELIVGGLQQSTTLVIATTGLEEMSPLNLYPSAQATGITVIAGLAASFIAQEVLDQHRWWVYTTTLVPILLVSLSTLYLGRYWFSATLGGVLLGLAICGATRVSFSHYNTRPLDRDLSLWLTSLLALLYMVVYISYW